MREWILSATNQQPTGEGALWLLCFTLCFVLFAYDTRSSDSYIARDCHIRRSLMLFVDVNVCSHLLFVGWRTHASRGVPLCVLMCRCRYVESVKWCCATWCHHRQLLTERIVLNGYKCSAIIFNWQWHSKICVWATVGERERERNDKKNHCDMMHSTRYKSRAAYCHCGLGGRWVGVFMCHSSVCEWHAKTMMMMMHRASSLEGGQQI